MGRSRSWLEAALGFGMACGAFSVFLNQARIVLRAKPVCFVISCSDSLSRRYIRRILPNISIVITLYLLPKN